MEACLESVESVFAVAVYLGTTYLSHRVGGLGYGAPSLSCLRKRKSACQSVCYKLFPNQRSMPQYLHARHESGEVGAWTGAQQAKRKTQQAKGGPQSPLVPLTEQRRIMGPRYGISRRK